MFISSSLGEQCEKLRWEYPSSWISIDLVISDHSSGCRVQHLTSLVIYVLSFRVLPIRFGIYQGDPNSVQICTGQMGSWRAGYLPTTFESSPLPLHRLILSQILATHSTPLEDKRFPALSGVVCDNFKLCSRYLALVFLVIIHQFAQHQQQSPSSGVEECTGSVELVGD